MHISGVRAGTEGKIHMKRIAALLLALCLTLSAPLAMAADHPFKADINYNQKYRENGAHPTMLNFGYAKLIPGEDLYDAKKTTVTRASSDKLEKALDDGNMFYIYAKWRFLEAFDSHFINAMLVMTDPEGNYYATYGEWDMEKSRKNAVYSWFFDMTDSVRRCREEHGGELPKGEYGFSMFFNDKVFRVSKVNVL